MYNVVYIYLFVNNLFMGYKRKKGEQSANMYINKSHKCIFTFLLHDKLLGEVALLGDKQITITQKVHYRQ